MYPYGREPALLKGIGGADVIVEMVAATSRADHARLEHRGFCGLRPLRFPAPPETGSG